MFMKRENCPAPEKTAQSRYRITSPIIADSSNKNSRRGETSALTRTSTI